MIAAQDALKGEKREYPTVLIIGSTGDRELAGRLRLGLAASRIPCWSIVADDEAALQTGNIIPAHSIYYDRLVLLCTTQSLESSRTSQHFAELVGGHRAEFAQTMTVLAADKLFYSREDRLCTTLKEGSVLDFRGWEDTEVYEKALASLVKVLSKERP